MPAGNPSAALRQKEFLVLAVVSGVDAVAVIGHGQGCAAEAER
jgi:hypothetical protein